MKCCGVILIIPVMSFKSVLSPEEVVIFCRYGIRIPCHVDVIVQTTYANDIPGVVTDPRIISACDDSDIKSGHKTHPVEQVRVALADRCTVYEGGIGRILKLIGFVIKVCIVINNMMRDIVINSFNFLILGLRVKVERLHDLIQL